MLHLSGGKKSQQRGHGQVQVRRSSVVSATLRTTNINLNRHNNQHNQQHPKLYALSSSSSSTRDAYKDHDHDSDSLDEVCDYVVGPRQKRGDDMSEAFAHTIEIQRGKRPQDATLLCTSSQRPFMDFKSAPAQLGFVPLHAMALCLKSCNGLQGSWGGEQPLNNLALALPSRPRASLFLGHLLSMTVCSTMHSPNEHPPPPLPLRMPALKLCSLSGGADFRKALPQVSTSRSRSFLTPSSSWAKMATDTLDSNPHRDPAPSHS